MSGEPFFTKARCSFHVAPLGAVLKTDEEGIPSNADKHSKPSVKIAQGILNQIGSQSQGARLAGPMAGRKFEEICKEYLEKTFFKLLHLRPGIWKVSKGVGKSRLAIAQYDQYKHLVVLEDASR